MTALNHPVDDRTVQFPKAKIMEYQVFKRIETRTGEPPVCKSCKRLIHVGQQYYSASRKYATVRYHWECASRLNIV